TFFSTQSLTNTTLHSFPTRRSSNLPCRERRAMATPVRTPRPVPAGIEPAVPQMHQSPESARSMRACVIRGIGELDQVEIAELPAPRSGRNLGAREVRVAVHAAALNHLDLFVVRGLPVDYTFPHVLGS